MEIPFGWVAPRFIVMALCIESTVFFRHESVAKRNGAPRTGAMRGDGTSFSPGGDARRWNHKLYKVFVDFQVIKRCCYLCGCLMFEKRDSMFGQLWQKNHEKLLKKSQRMKNTPILPVLISFDN